MSEPSPPITPPRQPGAMTVPPQVAVWPTVVGIISIVLGAFGILGGCMTIGSPYFTELISRNMPAGQATAMGTLAEWRTWYLISGVVGMGVATLLLIGGIGLVRRRANAVGICRAFAMLKILFVAANSVLSHAVMQEQLVPVNVQMVPPGSGQFVATFAVGGVVLGALWGWALPVFLLIWFSRSGVKKTVAGWHSRDANSGETSVAG